jgi:acetoacetyl-CoA synthetase
MSHRDEIVWSPAVDAWASSRLGEFAAAVRPSATSYDDVLDWSIDQPGDFWQAVADWADVHWHDQPTDSLAVAALPGSVWFPGGTLNYAEHALRDASSSIVGVSQSRDRIAMDHAALTAAVAQCRSALKALGVQRDDRVAAFLPNIHEAIVVLLATASIGAVFTSCAPEFGVRAVVDRWSQLQPVVVFAVDGYQYGRRPIDRRDEVVEIVAALESVRHVVLLPYLRHDATITSSVPVSTWEQFMASAPEIALEFEPVPFDQPLYVLFSSGTTGLPKPIVHGHGGILLEHVKALAMHHDLGPDRRFMWFTTTGWMMWNYLVSGLCVGATIVLFDGDPAADDMCVLWQIAADERLDVLGVSAPFIMACRKAGLRPGEQFDLSRVRQLGSTGAPLPADGFRWIRDAVGHHVQPASISGGTDVCTAFVGAAPTVAVRAGEITTRMLGCDVRAADPEGQRCPAGVTGELVIATPMPSMPVGLWGDDDGSRFSATYFQAMPGMWHHGDWITFFDDGGCVITGRSDATLNRGGVRLGTSDFYTVVESMPEIADSVVVHLEDDDGGPGTLILLVSCTADSVLDDDLRARIGRMLRTELSPRHVPDVIDQLSAVPRTLSGKKLEVPIKRLLLGHPVEHVASRGSLADPTALDAVVAWAATRSAG